MFKELTKKKTILLHGFVKTLKIIKKYISNYVVNKLSNAVTECLNGLIKSVRRMAFVMSNYENLKLMDSAISF